MVCAALLSVGCGTDTKIQLKPPSVYRDPQVRVTHDPTEIVVDLATIEAGASATVEPVAIQPLTESLEDDEQYWMDEIERLFNKIEGKLDRMDLNP